MTKLTISVPGDAASLRSQIGWFTRPEVSEIAIRSSQLPKERTQRDARALSFMVNDCGCAAASIGMVGTVVASVVRAESPIWLWSWNELAGAFLFALLIGLLAKALALAWSRGAARRRLAELERDLAPTMGGRS